MKRAAIFILILSMFTCIWLPVLSADEQLPYLGLSEFLQEMEMDFEQYLAWMNAFTQTGEYPHYLEKNAARYDSYFEANPDTPYPRILAFVNVDADKRHYTDITQAQDLENVSILVNKTFCVPSTWVPETLANTGTGHLMHEEAAEQFALMRAAITDAGLRMHVLSMYRSYGSQSSTFYGALEERSQAVVETNFARPGHSEHQTGLAIDLLHRSHDSYLSSAGFQNTDLFAWLMENGYRYGFILRYPREYRDIHGYIFEPWHWRYVGIDIATTMYNEEIVLYEDFYGRYIASDVLHKVRYLIYEERAAIAAQAAEELQAQAEERRAAFAQESEQAAAAAYRQAMIDGIAEDYAGMLLSEPVRIEPGHYILYYTVISVAAGLLCVSMAAFAIRKRRKGYFDSGQNI